MSRSTSADDFDYIALGKPDDIQKRNVGRAGIETAAALDAVLNRILLKFIHKAVLGTFVQKERLQAHRAGIGTFAAADTVALSFAARLFFGKIQKRR